jgi:hypothetical protein
VAEALVQVGTDGRKRGLLTMNGPTEFDVIERLRTGPQRRPGRIRVPTLVTCGATTRSRRPARAPSRTASPERSFASSSRAPTSRTSRAGAYAATVRGSWPVSALVRRWRGGEGTLANLEIRLRGAGARPARGCARWPASTAASTRRSRRSSASCAASTPNGWPDRSWRYRW